MKSSFKKITLAVLPLVALLLIAPSSALAKKKHKDCNRDYYSRYDSDYYRRYDRNQYYGRYYDDYYRRPSRSRSYDPYYGSPSYGSPYGNPYSSPSSAGTFPWWGLLFPRY